MDKRIRRLRRIINLLHETANSYAGDKTGVVAGRLHQAGGQINDCIRMLEEGITEEDEAKLMVDWFMGKPELLKMMAGQ